MTRTSYNFIRGMGSVLELIPTGEPSRVGQGIDLNRTDAEALGGDWDRVAGDFRIAFDRTVKDADDHVQPQQAK